MEPNGPVSRVTGQNDKSWLFNGSDLASRGAEYYR